VKGLSLKALYNNYNRQIFNKKFNVNYTLYEFKTTGQHNHILTNEPSGATVEPVQHNLLNEQYDRENSYQFNFFVNYARTFGLHDVNAVFVYEQSEGLTDWFNAQTTGFVSATVDQLFAGSRSTSDFSLNGSGSETGRLSYAGRVHYGYAEKYLIDLAFRYDGSVKFAPPQRWGFFPSVGAAWRISEENFFKNNVRFIDYLKLKASVGLTGNDAVGGWQWQENYVSDAGAQYGDIARGLRAGVIPNPLVTWEKSLIYDGGLEFAFLKNRLTLGLTTFYKHTYDVLGGRTNTIPSTFGGNMPSENYGEVDARGYEVELGFTDKVGNLTYRVGGNLAYATNKIVTMDEGENYPAHRSKIGLNNDRRLGFIYTDIIRTQADLDALPEGYTINGTTPMLGMLNYKDVRGVNSDEPDGRITDEDKEWIITHNIPPVTYGFYLGAQWKGFDLNLFFQGVAGMQLMDNQRLTVNHGRTNTYAIWEDHWTPENVNAKFPRAENSGWQVYPESSFWVYNGSFLRLKNLSFSYTLPKHILSNLGVGQAKIFFTGTNLLLLEDHVKYFDPELGDTENNVRRFPITKSYSLGINLSF
jgi:TonB-linked SusC/RagA family outer membrane protein